MEIKVIEHTPTEIFEWNGEIVAIDEHTGYILTKHQRNPISHPYWHEYMREYLPILTWHSDFTNIVCR